MGSSASISAGRVSVSMHLRRAAPARPSIDVLRSRSASSFGQIVSGSPASADDRLRCLLRMACCDDTAAVAVWPLWSRSLCLVAYGARGLLLLVGLGFEPSPQRRQAA